MIIQILGKEKFFKNPSLGLKFFGQMKPTFINWTKKLKTHSFIYVSTIYHIVFFLTHLVLFLCVLLQDSPND